MADSSEKNPVQLQFFEKLKKSVPQNVSLANDIADILEISTDGAYRRMRGESVLSMDELVKVCRHYRFTPELASGADDNLASFRFQHLFLDEKGIEHYMQSILSDLNRINNSEPKQITYAAADLPLFVQFISPEFAAFKIFFWQKSMLHIPAMESKRFSVSNIEDKLKDLCCQISEAYIQIPSIEIWHDDTILSNLKLIDYAWESGMFVSKEDAISVCRKMIEIINLAEKQASKSSKFLDEKKWAENEGNFTMYYSEFVLTNNHIMVTAGEAKALYLTHNTFNSMSTTDNVFCAETDKWLKNLIKQSNQISGVGEKQRRKFFQSSVAKITALLTKIESQ